VSVTLAAVLRAAVLAMAGLSSTQIALAQSPNAGAPMRWELVSSSPSERIMINRGLLEATPNGAIFFIAVNRIEPTAQGSRYTMARLELDCKSRSYRALKEWNTSEHGLQGKDLGDLGVFSKDYAAVSSNTNTALAHRAVCAT